jgi:ATP-dependent DNA helicase RecQ
LKGLEKVELIATQTLEEHPAESLPFENDLFSILKNIRRDIATQENVPPYVIVSDATLMEMATYLPQSLDELRFISGFGDVKLARYGREFLAPVKVYTHERGLNSKMGQKSKKRERKTLPNGYPHRAATIPKWPALNFTGKTEPLPKLPPSAGCRYQL